MVYDHTQSLVHSLCIADGLLYVGLGTYKVEIYDLESMKMIRILDIGWEVRDIAISDNHIFVGSLGETIKVFQKKTYKLIEELHHEIGVHKLAINANELYSLGYNEYVNVWNINTLQYLRSLPGHSERVNAIAFDGINIYTGDGFHEGSKLRKWSKYGELLQAVDLRSRRVLAIFDDKQHLIVSTASPSGLLLLDKETLEETKNILSFEGEVHTIRKCGGNYYIASHKQINEFTSEFNVTRSLNEMVQEISCLEFNDKYLIYAVRDRVQFVERSSFRLLNSLEFK